MYTPAFFKVELAVKTRKLEEEQERLRYCLILISPVHQFNMGGGGSTEPPLAQEYSLLLSFFSIPV